MEQQNEEKPEQPDKAIQKKVKPLTVSELFTLGRKPAEDLVYLLFWTGMMGVVYNAFVFGKYVTVNLSLMNTLSSDIYETTSTAGDHVFLGFIAGAIGLVVLFVLWRVRCELLLLLFKSLQKYVGSNN